METPKKMLFDILFDFYFPIHDLALLQPAHSYEERLSCASLLQANAIALLISHKCAEEWRLGEVLRKR